VAQLAERVLGKDEVTGPIPVIGSSLRPALAFARDGATAWQASCDRAEARIAKADGLASQRESEGCPAEAQRAKADKIASWVFHSNGEAQACRKKNLIAQN